ncbi:hypothetical protein [Streptomyces sp. NPDC005438]|uniref:HD domain-containing protein n=1 Tax=Streptomyces sp. NPDC005438 TaxID=3156880 RepID=UPI0033A8DED9
MASTPDTPHPSWDALLDRWIAVVSSAREGSGPDPRRYGEDLLRRWSEPQRRYHTVDHLLTVLDQVEILAGHASRVAAVQLAAWLHDAVYLPERSENEERSARLAERALTELGLDGHLVSEVARLVRLTVSHDPEPGDRNGEVLCDADLSILAADPERYAHYAGDVREEYSFVPEEDFRRGRAEVLRQLLSLHQLYRTPYGQHHWEEVARRNLSIELELLTGEPHTPASGTD